MGKFYISFGQTHAHAVAGQTFDKDCLAEVDAATWLQARAKAASAFGNKWSMCYGSDELAEALPYFPRGILKLAADAPKAEREP